MQRFAPASLTLIDGDLAIAIRPPVATAGDPIACRTWDLGAPEVRTTSTPIPGADGTIQGGGYFGARTVTMELFIRGDDAGNPNGHDPYWYAAQLAAMCHPQRSPQLKVVRADESSQGRAWYLGLRGNPWSLPYSRASASGLDMTLTFTAPDGYFLSDEHTLSSASTGGVNPTDWHFPAAFPKGFGPASNNPFLTIDVTGGAPVNPVLFITGPITNPKIRDERGQYFAFSNFSLSSGETVRIDMGDGSVLKANTGTELGANLSDVFGAVDFTLSTFWQWQPGTHRVALLSSTGTFAVQWRDRRLAI